MTSRVLLVVWLCGVWAALPPSAEAAQDRDPPRVRITEPADQTTVSGVRRIAIQVSDNALVASVTLYKDGALMSSDLQPPYEVGWDSRLELDGSHALVARARDMDWNEGESAVIHVTVDNTPPSVGWLAPKGGVTLSGIAQLEAAITDAVGVASATFLVEEQEIGTRRATPYTIGWNSKDVRNGEHTLWVRAKDRAGNVATSAPLTVQVANRNLAPHLAPISPKTINEGVPLSFALEAADPDDPKASLAFHAADLPPWAEFNPSTGEFSGTPGVGEASPAHPAKVYSGVLFEVCDAEPLCDVQETTITVQDANQPPTIEGWVEQVVNEGEFFTLKVTASDSEGDPLTCAVAALPPWAAFDPPSCTVTGVPGLEVVSQQKPKRTFLVEFKICDPQELCDSRNVPITVVDVNRSPVWEPIGHKKAEEDFPLRFSVRAEDPDRDPLALVASPLPDGATFTDRRDGTGGFVWKPRQDQAGQYEVVFTVTDGSLSDQGVVAITVKDTSLTVSGTVLQDVGGGVGIPLADTVVEIRRSTEKVAQAVTDADGFYMATGLRPGTYTVKPSNQPKEEFTTRAKTLKTTAFKPTHHQVTVTDRDVAEIDFTALR